MDTWEVVEASAPSSATHSTYELLEAEQQLQELEEMMARWNIVNTHKPFAKNVVCLLGTTSSGKSSFVNHFFGIGVKKTAACQLDTHFTLVEVVPESEFAALVGDSYKRKDVSRLDLCDSSVDHFSDSRRNCVYQVLNASATIVRHEQFESFANVFRQHELITSIVINEHYLPDSDEEEREMRRNTILIDSPGFTANTDFAKLRENLSVLQYLFSLSDLTLFCIPSDGINLVASQVAMLELSVLYALHGAERFNAVLERACSSSQASSSFSMLDIFSRLVAKAFPKGVEPSAYEGTQCWDRVRFVLTKIDRVSEMCCGRRFTCDAQFFELGCLLSAQLAHLKPPVFDQCYAIALPAHTHVQLDQLERVHSRADVPTNDLDRVIGEVRGLNYYESYAARIETSIQHMCDDLRKAMEASWYSVVSRADKQRVVELYGASKKRQMERLQKKSG